MVYRVHGAAETRHWITDTASIDGKTSLWMRRFKSRESGAQLEPFQFLAQIDAVVITPHTDPFLLPGYRPGIQDRSSHSRTIDALPHVLPDGPASERRSTGKNKHTSPNPVPPLHREDA